MRARLRLLALSPRGPQYVSRRLTELAALLLAAAVLAGLLAYSPVVAFCQIMVTVDGAL